MSQELLPFDIGYIPDRFQEKLITESNETPENKVQGLQEMKEFVEVEKSFCGLEFDDDFLIQFLRSEKYDVSAAFQRLKNLIKLKADHVYMFTNQRYDMIVKTFTNNVMTYFPNRCQAGCAILYINVGNWFPDDFPLLEVKRMAIILLLQALCDPLTQVTGFKVIINGNTNLMRHFKYCTFENLYLMLHGSQYCVPGIFHSYHMVNLSVTGKFCLQMMKQLFPEDLKRKIHIHSSPEELFNYFPAEVLPVEYGGMLSNYDMTKWLKRVMEPEKLEKMCGRSQH